MLSLVERLPLARQKPWLGYGFAILAPFAGFGVRMLLGASLEGYPFVAFLPFAMLTAFLFGIGPGIVAAVLCGFTARYFFIPPTGSLSPMGKAGIAMMLYSIVIGIQILIINVMQRANAVLAREREMTRTMSEMKTLMFSELQHRVSNKLQIIASLISLQRRTVEDEDARKALADAARRVGTIGRISRALYDPEGGKVALESLLRQLTDDICEASGAAHIVTSIEVDDGVVIDAASTVPFALIYAETISNALEHGFAHSGRGQLDVQVRREKDGTTLLLVEDDGAGLPAGFDLSASESLGLKIAATLARQLRGSYELAEGARGVRARLVLPAPA